MTDTLRDRIAHAIYDNTDEYAQKLLCRPDVPGASDVDGPYRPICYVLADAILAIPGIAVVELPGPDHHEPATEDTNGYVEWRYPHGSIATTDDGTIMWERWHITDPSKVRAAAAALLAAADHAERDQ